MSKEGLKERLGVAIGSASPEEVVKALPESVLAVAYKTAEAKLAIREKEELKTKQYLRLKGYV